MRAADWTAWTCRVRVAVTDPAALDEARAVAAADLDAVDRACSRFRDDSELTAVNAAPGRWTPVSPLLSDLLGVALRAARLTAGDVDPTVGASLDGVGYDRDVPEIDGNAPVAALPAPGWRAVEHDASRRTVRISSGARLDLGATAKAWTADRCAARISARTGVGCLVSIGGDVAVAGPPPPGGWRVRVEDVTGHPESASAAPGPVVTLRHGGLATSSIRGRRWKRGGVHLHHLLDPRTGLPPAPVWRTVSAAAGSCTDANTVTTAAVVRGSRAWPWLHSARLPARLVSVGGDVRTVGGWPPDGVR
jgi:thiamine biosynthesis lipoprotein